MSSDSRIRMIREMLTPKWYSLTTLGLYMFMLCYKNGVFVSIIPFLLTTSFLRHLGGLAREQIRDALPPKSPGSPDRWSLFNHYATDSRPLGASTESSLARIALHFPPREIVPNVEAGTYKYTYAGQQTTVSAPSPWKLREHYCRAILESQLL